MSSKKKIPITSSTSLQTLKIGSRVRCTDDHVEGGILWANAASVKMRWDDGEQVTWKRDSLAGRPIEILAESGDEDQPAAPAVPDALALTDPTEPPLAPSEAAPTTPLTEPVFPAPEQPASEPLLASATTEPARLSSPRNRPPTHRPKPLRPSLSSRSRPRTRVPRRLRRRSRPRKPTRRPNMQRSSSRLSRTRRSSRGRGSRRRLRMTVRRTSSPLIASAP